MDFDGMCARRASHGFRLLMEEEAYLAVAISKEKVGCSSRSRWDRSVTNSSCSSWLLTARATGIARIPTDR